jgi:hypothetical protein
MGDEKAKELTEEEIQQILSSLGNTDKYVRVTRMCDLCREATLPGYCKTYPEGIPDDIYYGKT